jgi:hypothetical protein
MSQNKLNAMGKKLAQIELPKEELLSDWFNGEISREMNSSDANIECYNDYNVYCRYNDC